ncbi:response regulator [Ammoniphilus sp. YIM 78166]|uniref:response regulator n=1 Tax=Ammoniphilus sp. YIM 78166 TaxID=1644106 RepID=UPI001070653A|nr:response regulator [Ammoniphilus sp. YIM 78166]
MRINVLIVEDDPMVSSINKRFLGKSLEFSLIGTAKNGKEALAKIKDTPIDLLLLDMYMPVLNGLELLKEIRHSGYQCDVIMITAADAPEVVEEALRLGVVDFILKPYDYKRFQDALMAYKRRYEMFRAHSFAFNQEVIDSLQRQPVAKPTREDELTPKGIDPITLNLVRETLQQSAQPLSAQDISDRTDLSRITTRKYLEYLAELNEIILDLKYSNQGRPTKLYIYAG